MYDTTHDDQNVRIAKLLGYEERLIWLRSKTDPRQTVTIKRWFDPAGKQIHKLPDFRGDLNASMAALIATGDPNPQLVIMYERNLDGTGRWYADVNFYDSIDVYKGDGDTPQQAAANALEALLVARAKEAGRE